MGVSSDSARPSMTIEHDDKDIIYRDEHVIAVRCAGNEDKEHDVALEIDPQTEEIYQSRVYLLNRSGSPRLTRSDAWTRVLPERSLNAGYKIVAKRSLLDGSLSFVLIAASGRDEIVVRQEDGVPAEHYWRFVRQFERLQGATISRPQVLTAADWKRYMERANV